MAYDEAGYYPADESWAEQEPPDWYDETPAQNPRNPHNAYSADTAGCADTSPTPLTPPRVPAEFPVKALPPWCRSYVEALAEATQTPPDLAGACVLGVLSACAGGCAVVEARPGWREPVNLYLLPVLPPGSRKSAVVTTTTRPLYNAERDMAEKMRAEVEEVKLARQVAEDAAEQARRRAARASSSDRDGLLADAVAAASAAASINVPVIPKLLADDVTPEAAISLLAEQGGRVAVISAEGGIFDVLAGRYSNGAPNLDVWLKGHAGDPIRVDRRGRPSEHVDRPAVTLLESVQPYVLEGIARNGTFRGRGLLARILYVIPASNVGYREVGAAPLTEAISAEYEGRVRALAEDMAGWTDPAVLVLSPEARERLLDFEREIEPRLRPEGDLGPMVEWASKLAGAVLRLAGLLHLAEGPAAVRTPISVDTLANAIVLGRYFIEHARAAFDVLGERDNAPAAYIQEHLRRKNLKEFSVRDLFTDLPRGRFRRVEDVTPAVAVLVEHGWLMPVELPKVVGPGRKPSPRYRVHPKLWSEGSDHR